MPDRCLKCGRRLTDPVSIAAGAGPVCSPRHGQSRDPSVPAPQDRQTGFAWAGQEAAKGPAPAVPPAPKPRGSEGQLGLFPLLRGEM